MTDPAAIDWLVHVEQKTLVRETENRETAAPDNMVRPGWERTGDQRTCIWRTAE